MIFDRYNPQIHTSRLSGQRTASAADGQRRGQGSADEAGDQQGANDCVRNAGDQQAPAA